MFDSDPKVPKLVCEDCQSEIPDGEPHANLCFNIEKRFSLTRVVQITASYELHIMCISCAKQRGFEALLSDF